MKKKELPKAVRLEWVDSASDNGRWTLEEDIENSIVKVISYGFVVEDKPEYITLALSYISEQPQYCQMISIPKCAIVSKKEIKL